MEHLTAHAAPARLEEAAGLTLSALGELDDPEVFTDRQRGIVAYLLSLAFESGAELGRDEGYERCNAEIVAALAYGLSGGETRGYAKAVHIHHRTTEIIERRQQADAEMRRPRREDYRGGAVPVWGDPEPPRGGRRLSRNRPDRRS